MIKDWKEECAKLRGEIKQLKEQLEWEREFRRRRESEEEERRADARKRFEAVFFDVLGR